MESIDVTALNGRQTAGTIIDVRELDEFNAGHIAGAVLIPLNTISNSLEALREHPDTVFVICHLGQRSALATQYLNEAGIPAINVDGGMHAWVAAGFPIQ